MLSRPPCPAIPPCQRFSEGGSPPGDGWKAVIPQSRPFHIRMGSSEDDNVFCISQISQKNNIYS